MAQALSIRLRRLGTVGPAVDVTNPAGNVLDLGPFTGARVADAIYEIRASNSCGIVTKEVAVHLERRPALRVVGIEVIQAIQRFAVGDPLGSNNNVNLVANKRTLARVYVDSGITDGFDNGPGPSQQPNVTGQVIVFPSRADRGFPAVGPLNAAVIDARPAASINRGSATQTLNFELPFEHLSGDVRIEAHVLVVGHQADIDLGWGSFGQTTVNFRPRRTLTVQPILVRDDYFGVGRPAIDEYNTSLQGARTRYPIAENGFLVKPERIHGTHHNLDVSAGWTALLTDIKLMALDAADDNEIWTAVVPNAASYGLNGMASGEDYFEVSPVAFLARATLDGTFAHEMGHTFGFNHAPCCLPSILGIGEPPDPRLPGRTEDQGWDLALGQAGMIGSGRGELMSYCGDTSACSGARRWPSIAFFSLMFDTLF